MTSFADVTIGKEWNDGLTGTQASDRSAPTINLQGETSYEKLLNLMYPVGCYFETEDASFDPNTAWGGTWTKKNVIDYSDFSDFEELTLKPNSGISLGGANGMYRIGNVIYAYVNFHGSTETVFTGMPKPKMPVQATSRRLAIPTSTAGTQSRFLLDANGTLVWDGAGNDNWQNGSFCYITDDYNLKTIYRWHRVA